MSIASRMEDLLPREFSKVEMIYVKRRWAVKELILRAQSWGFECPPLRISHAYLVTQTASMNIYPAKPTFVSEEVGSFQFNGYLYMHIINQELSEKLLDLWFWARAIILVIQRAHVFTVFVKAV